MPTELGPRVPRSDGADRRRLHRALADPSRARILAEVSDHGPIDVRDLSDRVGLHLNTVRAHLNALADAGLVESERVGGDGPGRPRLAYRSTGVEEAELRRYRLLAEILTAFVSRSGPDAVPELEEVGELWGHHLVESPPPLSALDEREALERLVTLLSDSGFVPRVERDSDGLRVMMEPCPFLELARRHPAVVCPVHLGLIRGALNELGGALTATRLDPFRTESLCVAHLESRAAGAEREVVLA